MILPTEPRAERIRVLLEALGDDDAYLLVRRLLRRRQIQAELVRDGAMSQAVASERLRTLRRLGLVERGVGGMLRVAHRAETLAVLELRGP